MRWFTIEKSSFMCHLCSDYNYAVLFFFIIIYLMFFHIQRRGTYYNYLMLKMMKKWKWLQIKSYIFTVHVSVSWKKTYLSKTAALCIALTVQQVIYYFDVHKLRMLIEYFKCLISQTCYFDVHELRMLIQYFKCSISKISLGIAELGKVFCVLSTTESI